MQPFHISLHAGPRMDSPEAWIEIDGRRLARVMTSPTELTEPLLVSFHEALTAMANLPRMYIEADGSWVWVGGVEPDAWQLDGTLYDRGTHLQYVEMKGTCTAAAFEQLVSLLHRPPASLIVQLMRHAVYLTVKEFRRVQFG